MSVFASPRFLPRVLQADALSGAATVLLHLSASAWLSSLLGLSQALLMGSALVLVVYVAACLWASLREPAPRGLIWMLIAGNWAWFAGCAVLFFAPEVTQLGQAYLVVNALVVAAFAELQWLGLRRAPAPGWA